MDNKLLLSRLQDLSTFFEERFLRPSFDEFEKSGADDWSALRLFVRGYAFEHAGRSPSFGPVASDVLKNLKESKQSLDDPSTPDLTWKEFCKIMEDKVNPKVNPLAPQGTLFKYKRKTWAEPKMKPTQKMSVVEFVRPLERRNIVVWTRKTINEHSGKGLKKAHDELVCINGVKDKIASLWLRDIAFQFRLEPPQEHRYLLFPVDIWVRRAVAIMAGKEFKSDKERAEWAIEECSNKLSPEKVNMGLWYLGAQIAESEYETEKSLKDESQFVRLVQEHLRRMERAVSSARPKISSWH